MSLTKLVNEPDVRERFAWCIPEFNDRKAQAEAKVPRAQETSPQRESMLGTAVDYALRFEIERNNRHAVKRKRWVADRSARLGRPYAQILVASREHVLAHVRSEAPWRSFAVARCSLLLAQLDTFLRSGGAYVPPLPTAQPRDILEVFQLVRVAPMTLLSHPTSVHLNTTFGRFSSLVGGADADLIVGTQLIDVKLSLPPTGLIQPKWIRQLIGYAMLAGFARAEEPSAPEIRSVGIYFARQGSLWTLNPGVLRHSQFDATAKWLRERIEWKGLAGLRSRV